mmetsp:Transcript_11260/g.21066  ORF Transcript_11260/g.21066 Transcript_11260/m.21066 type:complete len:370 (-) Transcript_11260:613-1722(-)|eukprot:CAMPEP_0176493590 /NCGR_PEP_ID=MMETSP0200_2-20121128/9628_1 /TAXON_ID=947934 /ORGANISM="Chaetoceros sp., Strain GSL56" /LENGTH=369 /DNA_ID=CAMNT_0017891259 /DNA_START=76 /DNA_END=1188 /DNA_ORIENTATION=+
MANVYSPLYLFVRITIIIIIITVTEGTSTTARNTILAATDDNARPIATFISSTSHITTADSSSSILQSTKTQQLLQLQQQQQDPPPSWTIPIPQRQYHDQHLQPHVKQFQRHGIFYKTSILSKEEFQMVQDDISSLNLHLVQETSSSVARHRIGAPLPSDCKTVQIFSNPNGRMMKLVNELVQQHGYLKDDTDDNDGESGGFHSIKLASCDNVPVEIRVYQQKGAGMELHHDDVLFSPEQIEVVFTLENSSDCITKWEELEIEKEEGGGGHVTTNTSWKHVETEANSAIILRAGPKGARHSVSSLKYGKRMIIKLVFVEQDAVFLEKAATGGGGGGRKTGRVISSQFAGGGNKNSKKKKKQKKKINRSK